MIYITNQSEIAFNQKACSLYFYASWLPFHKKFQIMIEKVEKDIVDIKFYAIDIDCFRDLAFAFNVNSIPTIITLSDNGKKEIGRIVGMTLTSAFKKSFADIYKEIQGDDYGKK